MKTSELIGPELDWTVAQACGVKTKRGSSGVLYAFIGGVPSEFRPSSDWAVGGPIIERERIVLRTEHIPDSEWVAYLAVPDLLPHYPHRHASPLVAAMRCYVHSFFGKWIELPKEFI